MKKWITVVGLALAAACSTPKDEYVECICGTPEEAIYGCPYSRCARGEGNPDNPDCVCGTLSLEYVEE
jgi:hypothetical protein